MNPLDVSQKNSPPIGFANESGETIPPYAVMRPSGVDATDGEQKPITVEKPDGSSGYAALLNRARSIAYHRRGSTIDAYGQWALYDPSDGTPQPGESWGPGSDWLLRKGRSGFTVVGGAESEVAEDTTYYRVRVARSASSTTVYEFTACDGSGRKLYATNTAIADHMPGGAEESTPVAVVRSEDADADDPDYWQLVGVAAGCAAGACVDITAWVASCNESPLPCYDLVPCDEAGTTYRVQGSGWTALLGDVVAIDGKPGCFTVTAADSCEGFDDTISDADVVESFALCGDCDDDYYKLENCNSGEGENVEGVDYLWIQNDLATYFSEANGAAVVAGDYGLFAKGQCWDVTDYSATKPGGSHPEYVTLPAVEPTLDCATCCYTFEPCDEEDDPLYFKPEPGDDELPIGHHWLNKATGKCYEITRTADAACSGATLGTPTASDWVDFGTGGTVCNCCKVTRWKECGAENYIRTYSDMCDYLAATSTTALKRAEDDKCYQYAASQSGAETLVVFTVEAEFQDDTDDCALCQAPRYKMDPDCTLPVSDSCETCVGHLDTVVTETDLSAAVGRWIDWEGGCYKVSYTSDATTIADIGCYGGPHNSCAACRAAPKRIDLIYRRKSDGKIWGMVAFIPGLIKCDDFDPTEECE